MSERTRLMQDAPPDVADQQRTIMLVVRHGFAARYLLRSGVFDALLAEGVRVVILAPNENESYFRDEFLREGVVLEHLEIEESEAFFSSSKAQQFLRQARFFSLGRGEGRETADIHYHNSRLERPKQGIGARLGNVALDLLVWGLRRFKLLRKALIRFESKRFTHDSYHALFERYRPDLLVTSSLGIFRGEEFVMREAVRHGIPTTAVILSWDNTTSKGMPGASADYVIAQTEKMRSELEHLHDIPPARVFVEGIASFDQYWLPERIPSREAFFEKVGLDPAGKLLVLATQSPNIFPWNGDLIRMIAEAIERGEIPHDLQVVVRLHPLHFRRRDGKLVYRALFDEYEQIQHEHSNVVFNYPAMLSEVLEADMPSSEMTFVAAMLKHADVLLNHFSTIAVEGCIMDLPTINLGFEPGDLSKATRLKHLCEVAEGKSHNLRIVAQGGVRTVHSREELYSWINRYVEDRTLDAEGRKRVRDAESGPNRGHAAEALAHRLLAIAGHRRKGDMA